MTDDLEGIAIIGMNGRFPGAENVAKFWENLRDGRESISSFTHEELATSGVPPAVFNQPHFVNAGGVLEDVELFDAAFFGFNPTEAKILDPQRRLFLECAWQALEDAGYNPETYDGLIGLYAGGAISTYLLNVILKSGRESLLDSFLVQLGNDKDYLTTQTSYKLNLRGPSITVQTACSTSLVAVGIACQSLLSHQCDMALAGGVAIRVPQKRGYVYQEGLISSPDGHCRAFDANAKGTVGGNGVGIVVLKRLADAIADGDSIHAVIKGSAINNDGAMKIGYTAPSVEGQAEAIALALAIADVPPETITYVETHGTATPLGDPIEIAALTRAFQDCQTEKKFCAIASVKSNIGHLDTAAGIAGLIKTVLMLKHKLLPPSLHFKEPNPEIDFARSPFYVNTQLSEWKSGNTPRRAGVSSFGIGGTNAHVILEESQPVGPSGPSRSEQLLLLSAKTTTALDRMTSNLTDHLRSNTNANFSDIAYTLQVGRKPFRYRRMLVCHGLDDALSALEVLDPRRILTATATEDKSVAFMFPGQGTQFVNMAAELYKFERTFREQVDHCSQLLRPHLGLDLRQVLYPEAEQYLEAVQRLSQTALTQPALFVVEYALAKLWMAWGIQPQAMIGHSLGEYVAACLAGVFSLEDALSLVAARGRLIQQLPGGLMLAVNLPEHEITPLLNDNLSLAATNNASQCVISGPMDDIARLERQLEAKGRQGLRLSTSHAFHSRLMEPILDQFESLLGKVKMHAPQIPYLSNITGDWITAAEATSSQYWTQHLRQTVRFGDGLQRLVNHPGRILLEVGPGNTLCGLAKTISGKNKEQMVLSSIDPRSGRKDDRALLLNTLGRLWASGISVDWSGFYKHERRHRISLPPYPFERQRYWIESTPQAELVETSTVVQEQSSDIDGWSYVPIWQQSATAPLCEPELLLKQNSSWLVFSDRHGLGQRLIECLKNMGLDVITVLAGEHFAQPETNTYSINPLHAEDYTRLFKELRAQGKAPQIIAHLWSITSNHQGHSESYRFETSQDNGFYSLLFLAQAIGEYALPEQLKIGVISNSMHAVAGEEVFSPERATMLGPVKVIPQEYPFITCQNIDIEIPASGLEVTAGLVHQLILELATNRSNCVVAYRQDQRWEQGFEAIRLDHTVKKRPRFREEGVYLITGGLGAIGLTIAGHLAAQLRAKLVLVGRSAFPERKEWTAFLDAHSETNDTSRKIRQLLAFEQMGATIMLACADVSNQTQMSVVINQTLKQFGTIHGVIHAAGIAGGGLIQLKTPEIAASVLAPKVKGLMVLDALLQNIELDFLVLCSSLSSILGGFGQVDYCGANAFLDAFAHKAASRDSRLVTSINWDTWQEAGMAVNTALPSELERWRAENRKRGILSKEGIEILTRIIGAGLPQVAVSTQNLLVTMQSCKSTSTAISHEEFVRANLSRPQHARPALMNAYAPPEGPVEQLIADVWKELLGFEQVGVHDNFFDLGGHSLLATQIISRLRGTFRVHVPMRLIFDAPTVAELAESLKQLSLATDEKAEDDPLLELIEQLPDDEIETLFAEG